MKKSIALIFLTPILYNTLLAQSVTSLHKLARPALVADASIGYDALPTTGFSFNWHQPIVSFRLGKKNKSRQSPAKIGYINASAGIGKYYYLSNDKNSTIIPHSLTVNFQVIKNKASFLELGYTGFAQSANTPISTTKENVCWFCNQTSLYEDKQNRYEGGLLIGYRANGRINKKSSFVFRINYAFLLNKVKITETTESYSFGPTDQPDIKTRVYHEYLSPHLNISFGIGF
jgi:hypothetical protein